MSFFQVIKIYLSYVTKHKFWYFLFCLFVVLSAIAWNILPLGFKSFIEVIESGNFDAIYQPFTFIIVAILGESIISQFFNYSFMILYHRVLKDIKVDALKNLQDQDYDFHSSKSSGKLIAAFNKGESAIGVLMFGLNNRVLVHLLALLIPIAIIFPFSKSVSLALLLITGIFCPIIYFALKLNVKYRTLVFEPEAEVTSIVVDNLANFETVKSFAREGRERVRFGEAVDKYIKADTKYMFSFRAIDTAMLVLNLLVIGIGTYIAAKEFQNNQVSLSTLILVITYLFAFPRKVFEFFYSLRDVAKSTADLTKFFELIQLKPQIVDIDQPVELINPTGEIEFKDVSFKYHEIKTLNNISFKINPGEKIALVGPSGAGKSTITKMLLRYYEVNDGEVLIDQTNINHLTQKALRELIGIVPQDPIMFNNTIFFNVGYALDDPTEDQVIDACKHAQIHDFIMTLPDKYQTVVGERGIKLSGGQRQRLAIARMILKNPKILIFDEATSALDSESESSIQKAFAEVSKNKTMIIIAHRLSTIVNCDRIFVIDKGEIIQEGNHKELVAVDGIYKTLWNIQSQGFANVD